MTYTLPQLSAPDMDSPLGKTLGSLYGTLEGWAAMGKQPFTLTQLAQQFEPDAPLNEAIVLLLGGAGGHWVDAGLTPAQQREHVMPCELAEKLQSQLETLKEHVHIAANAAAYQAAAKELAEHSAKLYAPY